MDRAGAAARERASVRRRETGGEAARFAGGASGSGILFRRGRGEIGWCAASAWWSGGWSRRPIASTRPAQAAAAEAEVRGVAVAACRHGAGGYAWQPGWRCVADTVTPEPGTAGAGPTGRWLQFRSAHGL